MLSLIWFFTDNLFLIILLSLLALFLRSYLYGLNRRPGKKLFLDQVNNSFPSPFTGEEIKCVCPATGELLGYDRAPTKDEVDQCVSNARKAQKKWAQTTFAERRAVLNDLMEAIVTNQDEIARASFLDTGKTTFELISGEIMVSCEKIRYTIRNGESILKPERRSSPLIMMMGGKSAHVEYYPLGVICAIIPWNYPFHNFISPVISALFSGNAIIVKGSEFATWSRRYFQEIVHDVLRERGYDTNIVQIIPGLGATGAQLVQSKGVDKILFIGSPETGKKVMKGAADLLKPVILELGGKDPFIVIPPCDLELCVDRAINGSFFNLGQNCISAERILVQKSIFEPFKKLLVEKMKLMRQGIEYQNNNNNSKFVVKDFGSMTVNVQANKVKELLSDATEKGATILHGGDIININEDAATTTTKSNLFFQPTVVTGLTPEMRLWTEEAFGPVMLLIPFDSLDDAVSIANATPFGLSCSVLSNDRKKALEVAQKVESGMCVINDYGMSYMFQDLPFGGCKESGFGCFNGPEGLRGFCRAKSVVAEVFGQPSMLAFPRFVRRPFPEITPQLMKNLMVLFYGWGLKQKSSALLNIFKLAVFGAQNNNNNKHQ
eukprot:TRINITY_DN9726_c0_g1_i1.p1 TRINITY_DN9726_c0_g1~~TRINITY_DN9726_c0_g1_i1.p1  ORF type:complete len:606 (-),score=95.46 TRINITY_DN9726_c0_g1_i1:14-1831(-)